MASKTYDIAFKLAAKMDKSYNHTFNLAEEIASKTVGKLAKVAAAIGGTVLSVDKIKECTEKAIGFESAMADVAKVVDGLKDSSGNATAAYDRMSREILDMTSYLPMTGEELAQITAAAGQAGIAAEDLTKFTETASKMGVAFDITANQAGDWMAQWRTSFKMSQGEVTTLADQINYLSNTSSENAVKLSEVVSRIGSLGEVSGLSAAEIAAIGASMTGVTAEISATGIKNLMKAMNAGNAVTNKQSAVLRKLGFSATEMARRMQTDAQGAVIDLLSAFERLPDAEKSAALTQYFGSESVAAIAPLLTNLENLETQFQKVGDSSLYAGSMESEFATRAATTENKIKLAQNAIDKLQISIGNLFLPLIGKGAEFLSGVVGGFTDKVPVYANKIESTVKKVWKSVEPLFNWVKKNPMLIAKSIAGIGVAIAAHKVVDGIMGMVKGFSLLPAIANPAALAIAGVTAAVTIAASVFSEMNRKAKAENLAAHFGNISLSMEEVEAMAKSIVRTDNLNKVAEALKIFGDIDAITGSIKSAEEEINKTHWMASIGLELTEDAKASYIENVNSFISDSKASLIQEQIAVNMVLSVLTDDTDEGADIVGWTNKYYNDNLTELERLGGELQNALNTAFNADGVLRLDAIAEITSLQSQISEITEKLAKARFDAKLEVLDLQFGKVALTAESVKDLQEASNAEIKTAVSELDTALEILIANANVQLADNCYIDSTDYDNDIKMYKRNYLENVGEVTLKASSIITDELYKAYGEEMEVAMPEFAKVLTNSMNTMISNVETSGELRAIDIEVLLRDIKEFDGMTSASRKNIADYYEGMKPTLDEYNAIVSKCVALGEAIPESVSEGILTMVTYGAVAGEADALFTLMGSVLGEDNPEFIALLKQMREAGGYVPEELMKGVALQYTALEGSALSMAGHFTNAATTELEKGLDVTVPIRATADYKVSLDSIIKKDSGPTDLISLFLESKVDGFASGSNYTPRTFIAGERGPELITDAAGSKVFTATETSGILNGLSRLSSAFGTMFNFNDSFANYDDLFSSDEPSKLQPFFDAASYSDSSYEINFNPEIKIEGNGHNAADIERQIDELMEEQFSLFKQFMKEFLDEREERRMRLSNE